MAKMQNGENWLWLAPLICALLFPVTFLVTYTISVAQEKIVPFFSYISDTGTYPIASCVFTFGLSVAAFLLCITVYIRFKQVEAYYEEHAVTSNKKTWINRIGFVLGIITAVGVNIVGCFQENTINQIHFSGAFMAFCGGPLFLAVQAYFTFEMLSVFGTRFLGYLRYMLSFLCLALFITCFTTGTVSLRQYAGPEGGFFGNWYKSYGGWPMHITSVIAEWVMAALLDVYILTFVPEFKKIYFQPAQYKVLAKPRAGNNNQTPYIHRVSQIDPASSSV